MKKRSKYAQRDSVVFEVQWKDIYCNYLIRRYSNRNEVELKHYRYIGAFQKEQKTCFSSRCQCRRQFIFYLRMSQLCRSVQYAYRSKILLRLTCTDSVQFQKKIQKNSHCGSRSPKIRRILSFHVVVLQRTATEEMCKDSKR